MTKGRISAFFLAVVVGFGPVLAEPPPSLGFSEGKSTSKAFDGISTLKGQHGLMRKISRTTLNDQAIVFKDKDNYGLADNGSGETHSFDFKKNDMMLRQACDWQCYLDRYHDLQNAFGAHNVASAAAHYHYHGRREGRDCTCTDACNWQCYLDRYPDLQNAFGAHNVASAAAHYHHHGRREGRDCTCTEACNWQCYLDRYSDLQNAFGAHNVASAEAHYRFHGKHEGRDCTCPKASAPPLSEVGPTGKLANVYFEGGSAQEGPGAPGTPYYYFRPGFIKFKRCTQASGECELYEECPSEIDCGWTRASFEPLGQVLLLNTADPKPHVADYWLECSTKRGTWHVYDQGGVNADVKVYLMEENGIMTGRQLTRTMEQSKNIYQIGHTVAGSLTGPNRISVVIKPINPHMVYKVGLKVDGYSIDDMVADCLDNKMCLTKLDDSQAGREIRESNLLQLACLQKDPLSAARQTACDIWTGCLETHKAEKDMLLGILHAALSSGAQLAQREATTDDGKVDGSECVHPASDDPESWECECAALLYDACKHRWGDLLAACMKEQMCGSSKICQSWKTEAGCQNFLLSNDNESMQEKELTNADSLEESLLDKRSC